MFCVPQGSLRASLIKETHEKGLIGQFKASKTLEFFKENLFWLHKRKHAEKAL